MNKFNVENSIDIWSIFSIDVSALNWDEKMLLSLNQIYLASANHDLLFVAAAEALP